ncbi:MAG: glycosyltransferase family 4 protein [Thermoplasmatota archaeon]
MRIALATPYYDPHVGGVESHVRSIALELARRGHEIDVLTTRLPGAAREEVRGGVTVRRLREAFNLFTTPVNPGLANALAEGRYDLVHSHSPPPVTSYLAARAARRARLPHVLTYHCDLEIPVVGGALLVEIYRRTLGRATVRQADAVIATTRTYASTSRSLWQRDDVRVIPNPVDAERFRPDVECAFVRRRHRIGERRIALFVGRLSHHKGVEEFIASAAFTPENVVHLVVGDGPRRNAFEALAARVPRGKVLFAGRVDSRDLPGYYAASDLSALPSTSRLEAFGIAALEAMASARPVVVSRIPGVSDVVVEGETGLLAEPLDARDLAEQIAALAQDPETARAMGKRARERVLERFTVARVVDELEKVYGEVLAKRAEPSPSAMSR